MSAQGGTLQGRRTIEVPLVPVAILVFAAVAAVLGMTLLRDTAPTGFVTSVTETQRFENSTAAVREQGAVAPVIDLTNSGVAIQHRGFAIPEYVSQSHAAPSMYAVDSATYGTDWGSIGGQNEALHRQYSPPQAGPAVTPRWGPIMVNGEPCMQCR
jgi:hypothetical protein